jgi:hypothetical protein
MVCTRCNRTVPEKKIACDCFQLRATEETKLHALILFNESKQPLYVTNQNNGKHLLPRQDHTHSFCGKEFKQPSTTPLWLDGFRKLAQHDVCITCAAIVTRSFAPK